MKISSHAWPFVAIAVALTLVAGAFVHPLATIPPLLFLVFTLWFFRDPERDVPQSDGIIVSPADGTVIRARPNRVSIFMSVLSVHICRAPAAGRVVRVTHHRGSFLAAWKDEASEHNERVEVVLDIGGQELTFTLVAGLVARRILPFIKEGQQLERGERVGLIRFGSRVDIDLPAGWNADVAIKQGMTSGETLLARRKGGDADEG